MLGGDTDLGWMCIERGRGERDVRDRRKRREWGAGDCERENKNYSENVRLRMNAPGNLPVPCL